jgi:hypothetical protein
VNRQIANRGGGDSKATGALADEALSWVEQAAEKNEIRASCERARCRNVQQKARAFWRLAQFDSKAKGAI